MKPLHHKIRATLCILATLPLMALVACTVGPDFRPSEIDAPQRYVAQDVLEMLNEGRETQTAFTNWWEGFSDPMLDGMVERALENNLRISAGVARLRNNRAALKIVAAGDKPRITTGLESGYDYERELGGEETRNAGSIFGVLGLEWQPDISGRTRRRVESARAGVEQAEAGLRGLVLEVSAEVVQEYLSLRGNQRQLVLLRESVELQEKTLAIVRSRFESGLSPELDLRRAETSVERLRADIPPLLESLSNSRNRLATLTGQYPGAYETALLVSGEIPSYESRISDPLPLEVLTRRPDIRQTEARLKQAIAEIGVAEAEFYPTLDLASQIGVGASVVSGGPNVELLIATLNGLIQQVVYDGGARQANLEGARARAEAALFEYRQALLDVSEEVESALNAIRASRDSQIALEKAVESSSRSFGQAEALYQQGLISFLDVVDAQRVLADAEQQLAAERTSYATRIANLFQVLGTRVDITPIEEARPSIDWDAERDRR